MSYSGRRRYKSRRERTDKMWSNFKVVILFLLLAAIVLLVTDWTDIKDHISTYFR